MKLKKSNLHLIHLIRGQVKAALCKIMTFWACFDVFNTTIYRSIDESMENSDGTFLSCRLQTTINGVPHDEAYINMFNGN